MVSISSFYVITSLSRRLARACNACQDIPDLPASPLTECTKAFVMKADAPTHVRTPDFEANNSLYAADCIALA